MWCGVAKQHCGDWDTSWHRGVGEVGKAHLVGRKWIVVLGNGSNLHLQHKGKEEDVRHA
jgi:hypothetical protein